MDVTEQVILENQGHSRIFNRSIPRLSFRLGIRGQAQKLLKAMLAAKVGCLTIAFGVKGGVYIHGHATDRVHSSGV